MKGNKGAVGKSLAYSLQIGYSFSYGSGKIERTFGEWWRELLFNDDLTKMHDEYAELAKQYKLAEQEIEENLKDTPDDYKIVVLKAQTDVFNAMLTIENKVVKKDLNTTGKSNQKKKNEPETIDREAMLRLIGHAAKKMQKLNESIKAAKRPIPKITVKTDSVKIKTGIKLTVEEFAAEVEDELPLTLSKDTFLQEGDFEVDLCYPGDDDWNWAKSKVKVKVSKRTRTITIGPQAKTEIFWTTPVDVNLLDAKADGEGKELTVSPAGTLQPGTRKLTITAPGNNNTGWYDGTKEVEISVKKLKATISYVLPTEPMPATTEITVNLLKAKLVDENTIELTEKVPKLTVSKPPGGLFGQDVQGSGTIELAAKESEWYDILAPDSFTIQLAKVQAAITWDAPKPVCATGDVKFKLSSQHLNAKVTPSALQKYLEYTPKLNTDLKPGLHRLTVTLKESGLSNAATKTVVLTIVDDPVTLQGVNAVLGGNSIREKPERFEEWTENSELRKLGLSILSDALGKNAKQMEEYCKSLCKKNGEGQYENENVLDHHDGKQKTISTSDPELTDQKIILFKHGLQLRYKPNGDKHNRKIPQFCLEVRNESVPKLDLTDKKQGQKEEGEKQSRIAYKIALNGKPGPKGSGDIDYPSNLRPSTSGKQEMVAKRETDREKFRKGVLQMTHIFIDK